MEFGAAVETLLAIILTIHSHISHPYFYSLLFVVFSYCVCCVCACLYTADQNVFSVVHELRNATQARVDNITRSSIVTALGVYGVIAIAGFCTYGSEVESNILVSYPTTHLVSVGRMFVSLLTAFSFPIVFQPGRNSVLGLWRYVDKDGTSGVTYRSFRYVAVTVSISMSMSVVSYSIV